LHCRAEKKLFVNFDCAHENPKKTDFHVPPIKRAVGLIILATKENKESAWK
jgi:hypothetical protein